MMLNDQRVLSVGEIGRLAGLPTVTAQQIESLSGIKPYGRIKAATVYLYSDVSTILTRIGERLIATAKSLL